MADDKPFSTGDVARLLHVSGVTVFQWIRAGKLPAYRVPGGRYRIARAAFRKFLSDNQFPLALDPTPPRRILVIDDDARLRESLDAALRHRGCVVAAAGDGESGLRLLAQEQFDLIFLDIILPGARGSSVLQAIKRQDPQAIVVLITGYPDHDETLAALEHGPAMLLRKPVKLGDIDAVLDVLARTRVTAAGEGRHGRRAGT